MQRIPKLYKPMKIRFSSLRAGIGCSGGVIFDIDTMVDRWAMRVRTDDGWKWQLMGYLALLEWDCTAEIDQEILTEYGADIEITHA